jgi:TonB-linked SusC/RagA family outer membrane protein
MKKTAQYKWLMLLGVFFASAPLFAQGSILLKGNIKSATDNFSLPGATVVEIDKNNRVVEGVVTDANGNFAIRVESIENKLQFGFVGFKSQTMDINNKRQFNIKLEEDVQSIQAVEVIAEKTTNTGVLEIDDRNLAIPVAKISTKDIEGVQASSIDEALQGRLSGVDIVSNSGDPGGGMSIRIRGVNSLNAKANPLIVIDDIPYETNISPDFDFATANEEGYAQMLNISIDDIKEITVLKDASATALYGTKASNGVLMVTTKRGSKGRKPVIGYSYRGTVSRVPDPIPMLNGDQYSTLILEGYMNREGIPFNTLQNKEFQYDPNDPWWYYNYGQNTDWLDEISQTGFTNNHDLSIAGGGQKALYRVSTNYQGQKGITKGTDLKRFTSRVNLDYIISDKLKITADVSYAHGFNNLPYAYSSRDPRIRDVAYRKMPNMAVYEFDENGTQTDVYFSPENNIQGQYISASGRSTYNPLAMAENGKYNNASDRITTKFSFNYQIIKGLKYRFDVSFDMNNTKRKWFLPEIATGRPWNDINVNNAIDWDKDESTIYTNNNLTYFNTFNDIHVFTATIQFQTNDYRGVEYKGITANSASSELQDPSDPGRIIEDGLEIYSSTWQNRDIGILGMFHYTLLDRYILSAGIRREGNSRFDKKYRYGYFPSLSSAWRISGEPFMQRFTFLDDLRLKGSWGMNGNPPRYSYMFFNNYGTVNWPYLDNTAVYPIDMKLENMKWETIVTSNIGFSIEMFKSRIIIDYDLYRNRTRDMLSNFNIGSSTGYDRVYKNIGILDNNGWDFNVRTFPIRNQNWTVSFNFNIARNYNILQKIDESFNLKQTIVLGNGNYPKWIQTGNPIGSFYGYKYEGVYKDESELIARDQNGNQIHNANGTPVNMIYFYPDVNYEFQPGDAKYKDINHDGNIDYNDIVYLGNANPDLIGGFGSTIKYKNLSFNFYFYGRYGNDIINKTKMNNENMYNYDNQSTATLRRWKRPGDETDIPRALIRYGYNWLGSDRFVDDGSFLRLKYLTFSYEFPRELVRKMKMQSLRISTTFNNLLTFTNYEGQDPEININSRDGTVYTVGYDESNTPRAKEVTVNLNVTF